MIDELTTNLSKEDFIEWMDKRLAESGFTKDPEQYIWVVARDVQGPSQIIVINGQRHDQPGESHHFKFEVELFGDGEMKDIDTEIVNSFIEVNFNIYQDDYHISEWPTFCMFFDDQILFDSILNKMFEI